MKTRLTVWYDAACPLCRREIAAMRWLDWRKRIDFIDATDPAATCPINRKDLLDRFHAMEQGTLLSGASAFAAMWRATPLLWPLGMVARLPGMMRLLERAYRAFLRVRPRLQEMLRD